MSHRIEESPLMAIAPGNARRHMLHRFGEPGARPKAYLQAALHADEIPGLLVLHHLLRLLIEADRAGAIRGEIVIAPYANPIGLSQRFASTLLGRYEFDGHRNFNRGFPNLDAAVIARVEGKLGADAEANVATIRAALLTLLDEREAETEIQAQRLFLMRNAVDADIVLDLHCDLEAVLHLFLGDHLWPDAADLSAQLGAEVTILAVDSGGDPFDEACSRPWWALAKHYGDRFPVPAGCLAATVELRGTADVADRFAAPDAENLFRFLQRRGLVAGDPGPLPEAKCAATPLTGVDHVAVPRAGVVAYCKEPGDRVAAGEVVAELVDPAAADPTRARIPLKSRASGILFGREAMKFARAGDRVCKIAGAEPLPGRVPGKLMLD